MTHPEQTTEYGLAELVAGEWRPLPQCGSWYTDRHYADDLTGRAAAEAALASVAALVPGTYRVDELRTFTRSTDPNAYAIVWDDPRRADPNSGASYVLHIGTCRDVKTAERRGGHRSVAYFPSAAAARALMTHDDLGDLDDMPCVPEADRQTDNPCEGHESLAGEHMGETVHCDGTCR